MLCGKSEGHKRPTISTQENVVNSVVDSNLCVGCGVCASVCPTSCLKMKANSMGDLQVILKGKCNGCGLCLKVCPFYEQDINIDLMAKRLFGEQAQIKYEPILGYFHNCGVGVFLLKRFYVLELKKMLLFRKDDFKYVLNAIRDKRTTSGDEKLVANK